MSGMPFRTETFCSTKGNPESSLGDPLSTVVKFPELASRTLSFGSEWDLL
jgi:hypothetical protein